MPLTDCEDRVCRGSTKRNVTALSEGESYIVCLIFLFMLGSVD